MDNKDTSEQVVDLSEVELNRYIEQTNEVRDLSSPQIRDLDSADDYRIQLLENFSRIGMIALDNGEILSKHFFPAINSDEELGTETVARMRRFSQMLVNAYQLNNVDSPIVYQQAIRILKEADAIDNDRARIIALDEVVSASYVMMNMTLRLLPVSDVCYEYCKVGFEAATRMLDYLDKERFVQLDDEMKEYVLINSRYIRVVSEIDGALGTPEQNARAFQLMMDAFKIYEDPFYHEQLPDYNWKLHLFRILEYIASFTDLNNSKGYNAEQIKTIYEYTLQMKELYDSEDDYYRQVHVTSVMDIYYYRNSYLSGAMSLEEYKDKLVSLINTDFRESESSDIPLIMLHAPLEYILVLDPDNLSAEEERQLKSYYSRLISYMHQTPKKDRLSFLLTYLALILKNYIELPVGPDFETFGLSVIAALHPPTYVHTLSVADFSKNLTHHLLRKNPEVFIGSFDCTSVDDVLAHAAEIEDFAYHAALCHDFGKLLIAETILTYGRNLLDDEFGYIKSHPSIGAYLLERFEDTAPYADVARGHHRWFNNKGGYPFDFDIDASPYKPIISVVTVADCLDAATDTVGRSYKKGLSFEDFAAELKEECGTRYAPYVVDLFDDPKVCAELEQLLETERDKNYREAYFVLKRYEAN
ncbi:MAG: HD domain-containing protein [Atopobiaceae bacterium]|nr:HD domain-containing protein [Atopobiaceae bacterium]